MTNSTPNTPPKTHFGHSEVPPAEKTRRVRDVFDRVAVRYDLMNDLISLGLHRPMKQLLVQLAGIREGHVVMDLAGGTGDVSRLLAPIVGKSGRIILTDPNREMLTVGRDAVLNAGFSQVDFVQAMGESLPFPSEHFDAAFISFGLRNFTAKDVALKAILRCLKPGATLVILEFSHPTNTVLSQAWKTWLTMSAQIGKWVVGDAQPYRYLKESIAVHPHQAALQQMMDDAGYVNTTYFDLMGGIAAIHRGQRSAP